MGHGTGRMELTAVQSLAGAYTESPHDALVNPIGPLAS